ncbi:hypothetical protein LPJ72_003629 [Coemansia sp. Benny D160-2]|nr:hypothetical protein LPJ72_003629 [Coemansia sp. Benny D160-2]
MQQMQRASWPRHRTLPPNHPVLVSMAKRRSIFYRRPKPAQPPEDADIDVCSCPSLHTHDTGYDPGSDTSGDDSGEDEEGGVAEYEAQLARRESQLRFTLCQALPFWGCYFAPDTQSFIETAAPPHIEAPTTVKAAPTVFSIGPGEYFPPTPEIVATIVEYLNIIYKIDTCSAVIPMGRRLPDLNVFIWQLMDATMTDLWTAIACVILLQRVCRVKPSCDDAPYEAAHTLFLGVFMLATNICVCTNTPELFELSNIARILDSWWYEKRDLVRIKHETVVLLDYKIWVTKEDIMVHSKNNMFDVYRVKSAYSFFERRQAERLRLAEEEQRRADQRRDLLASLEKFMYRTPHDSLGSWNQETMYCTESRFLFRHLPWFPGIINPMTVTARSENLKKYTWKTPHYRPTFSPLLPPTRTRVSSSTQ